MIEDSAIKLITIVIILAILFVIPQTAVTANEPSIPLVYLALGDSVPAYYGVTEQEGYVRIFSEKIKEYGFDNYCFNYAISGDDTADMLKYIYNDLWINRFKASDIITLNIGGNNLLGPIQTILLPLIAEIEFDFSKPLSPEDMAIFEQFTLSEQDMALMRAGVEAFESDFPKIISHIRQSAPNAKIIVSTVYNPIPVNLKIHEAADILIPDINKVIYRYMSTYNYVIADTYTAFAQADKKVINFDLSVPSIDPHPNVDGHALMAQVHYEVFLKINQPAVPVKIISARNQDDINISALNLDKLTAINLEITGKAPDGCELLAAFYNSNGELLNLFTDTAVLTQDLNDIELICQPSKDTAKVRIMLWYSFANIEPLASAYLIE